MIPGLSQAKLIGGLVGLLILAFFVAERGRWMHRAHVAEAENATVCASVRAASDNPKLDCKRAAQQVGELGKSIDTLKSALSDQNAKVAALGAQTAAQQAESAKALKTAVGRAQKVEATSERLAASSRAGEAQTKPCEPSKALSEAWK